VSATVPTAEEFEALVARVEKLEARLTADRGDASEWLTVSAAANYAGCTVGRIRKLVERRRLAYSQEAVGCRIFISRSDLDQFIRDQLNETRA
jgi:excisionase family DNA binding protein